MTARLAESCKTQVMTLVRTQVMTQVRTQPRTRVMTQVRTQVRRLWSGSEVIRNNRGAGGPMATGEGAKLVKYM